MMNLECAAGIDRDSRQLSDVNTVTELARVRRDWRRRVYGPGEEIPERFPVQGHQNRPGRALRRGRRQFFHDRIVVNQPECE